MTDKPHLITQDDLFRVLSAMMARHVELQMLVVSMYRRMPNSDDVLDKLDHELSMGDWELDTTTATIVDAIWDDVLRQKTSQEK